MCVCVRVYACVQDFLHIRAQYPLCLSHVHVSVRSANMSTWLSNACYPDQGCRQGTLPLRQVPCRLPELTTKEEPPGE